MKKKVFFLLAIGLVLLISGCKGGGGALSNEVSALETLGGGGHSSGASSYVNPNNLLSANSVLSSPDISSSLPISREGGMSVDIVDVSVINSADYSEDLSIAAKPVDEITPEDGFSSNTVYHNPEPNTIVLFVMSLLGLLGYGRSKLRR